ncbi:Retrovirus-related Pol polyprotein from transposon TNT 1-94 [Vitis vinifera]|uniref:Retrovirus-related Pol polyprotein from transposon TNT 1-94 n=1 Tax=Vitis vinifera TaxID=29760 RepID=A0A438H4G1_VITVI|nr:Retrovirus-related Pol polyprotein from transposon TNT 1-94 [Vitis vinifera]
MTEVLTKNQTQTHLPTYDASAAQIGIKLDGINYALWSQVVEMYISGKDKLGYNNGDFLQPEPTDPTFRRWRAENAIVKGWLINSMDLTLINNFIRFPTAKLVWDYVATAYFDGTDTSQVYDLKRRVTKMRKVGGSIEKYYNDLQGLVYIFLDGLGDRLDKIRSDVLQIRLFPTIEQAYAHVRREEIRQAVMLIVIQKWLYRWWTTKYQHQSQDPIKRGGYTHYGNMKHTRETYFKLHGYPDWWNEYKARKNRDAASNERLGRAALIIDSGATDHMTFNSDDFIEVTQPRRIDIVNANGVTYPITRAGTVDDILTKEIIGHGLLCDPWPSSRKFMCSNTPKKWGCRKKNRLIPETTRALLLGAHVPSRYWDDAIATAVYLLNRMPSKVLQFKTLLQVLSEHVSLPTILLLPPRIFGCVAFIHLHKKQQTKLDPCVIRCIFVGGDIRDEKLNWWTWQGFEDNPVQMSDGNEAVASEEMRDNLDIIQEAPSESPKPKNEEPHSSVPEAHFPKNTPEGLPEPLKEFVHRLSSYHVPSTVQEALSNPKWSQAIKAEMEALEKSKTWALVPLPKEKKTMGCRWAFSIKHKADGSIEWYKARLVAKDIHKNMA